MKALTFLVPLAFLLAMDATAQILVGPVAGPQVSWVSFDNKGNKDLYGRRPSVGYHMGFGLSFRVHNRFFLHTALLYSTKGKRLDGKADQLLKFNSRYRYIDLPMAYTVEFRHNVGKTRQYKWYFGLGPHVSYWLGGKGSIENTQLSEILVNRIDYKMVFDKEEGTFQNNEMNITGANRLQLGLN